MPGTDALQAALDLLALMIPSRRPGLPGYAIVSAIEDRSGEVPRADEGSLDPAPHRMEEGGRLRAEWIAKDQSQRLIYRPAEEGARRLSTGQSRRQTAANRILRTV